MRIALAAAAAAAGAALLLPAGAQAHVSVQPGEAEAGGFSVLDVRVPNESASASTVKVDVQLPPGFAEASYEPKPGWSVRVVRTKLAKPIQTDDGAVTEQVSRIVWTGSGKGLGKLGPGQFTDFPLSVQLPDRAGATLTFKALQTYSDGKVVRWIGEPGSDTPAPTVRLTASGSERAAAAPQATPAPAAAAEDDGSDGLAIAALAVGIVALLLGGAATVLARRQAGAAA
jgi:uncharacterized protein YcnI